MTAYTMYGYSISSGERNEGDDGRCCKGTERRSATLDVVIWASWSHGQAANPRRCGAAPVGGGLSGACGQPPRAGNSGRSRPRFLVSTHSDHVAAYTQEGNRVFPHADVYVAKAEVTFGCPGNDARRRGCQPFFQRRKAIGRLVHQAGKWQR